MALSRAAVAIVGATQLAGFSITRRIFPIYYSHSFSSSSLLLQQLVKSSVIRRNVHTSSPPIMVAEDFETVLKGKYPARNHTKRVVELIRNDTPKANGLIYLEGTHTKYEEDNDNPEHFRQRRYFFYLTGCDLPDCYFIYDIQSSISTLFIPPLDPDDVIWCGLPMSTEDALAKYDVDEVKYTTEVNAALSNYVSVNPKATIFAIENQISDHITISEFQTKDLKALKSNIETARIVKDEYEIALIRKANNISSVAHKAVVEKAKTAKNESEFEATFLGSCIAKGAKKQAYGGIFAAGTAAATLHYVNNDATLEGKTNLLIDAGCEWENYASDITRTFPLNGKFTPESRQIYDIVLKMMKETMADIKPGKAWDDLHLLAHKVLIDGLLSLGILKGDKDEILKARTSAAFFPHGLGHYLGMDTHDVGGNPNRADKDILFRYLRLRATLPAGSVVTVEPGCYFCRFIIEPYLKDPFHSKFIDSAVLEKYWEVGGVRIEDNVLVTVTGHENLTTVVKEAEELEALALGI